MSLTPPRAHLVLTIGGCFGGGSLYGWSGYLPAVRAQFEVSNAAASMVFSFALVSFTFGVLIGPILSARVPAARRLPLLAGLATLCLAASGASAGFAGFVLAYGVFFGFASGALYNLAISVASASGNPTLLVPVSVAAFGLGGAVFGPVHLWLTEAGWGLWSVAPALLCLALVVAASLVCRFTTDTTHALLNKTPALVRPNKTLAMLWVILSAGSCSGLIVLGFAAQFLSLSPKGAALAGLAVFLAALGNTLGRLSAALTANRFGPAYAMAGALCLSILTLACLLFTTAPAAVVGFLFLVALAYGQLAATIPLLVKSHVAASAFSGSFGLVFTGWGVAGLVGPWTAGWLLDATGTLRYALILCMALAALSLALVLWLARRDGRDVTS